MSQPVAIENEHIRLDVWPTFGGKVSSIVDKADGYDLLFGYPAELPTRPLYDSAYESGWNAGWDECFPAIAPGRYPSHPYEGVAVPDHGELWGLPTLAVPTKHGITTVWNGLRFGYRLTRKLHLEENTLTAEYSLTNLAPFEFRFVWSMHAMLSLHQPVQLDFPDGTPFRFSHGSDHVEDEQLFHWPVLREGESFAELASLPEKRAWKIFSMDPVQGPLTVRYPTRSRRLSISYQSQDQDVSLPAYWGMWVNTGGWSGQRYFSIEPTTGRHDWLDRSVHDGSAGRLGPSARQDWTVRWTLGA